MAASPAGELPSFGRGTTSGRLRQPRSYNSDVVMILLTLAVCVVTFGSGRTNVIQGVVHIGNNGSTNATTSITLAQQKQVLVIG